MSKKQNKIPPESYIGLGLAFGAGIGITFSPLFGDSGLGLIFGSSIGLMLGAVAFSLSKNKSDNDEN
jgi:F0F1-type ATP synthase assembly protein I